MQPSTVGHKGGPRAISSCQRASSALIWLAPSTFAARSCSSSGPHKDESTRCLEMMELRVLAPNLLERRVARHVRLDLLLDRRRKSVEALDDGGVGLRG